MGGVQDYNAFLMPMNYAGPAYLQGYPFGPSSPFTPQSQVGEQSILFVPSQTLLCISANIAYGPNVERYIDTNRHEAVHAAAVAIDATRAYIDTTNAALA